MLIKALSVEQFMNTTPSAYANANVLRVFNPNTTSSFLLTIAANLTSNVSSVTIGPQTELLIEKESTYLISCNAASQQVFG
jgi:hypothetical protein